MNKKPESYINNPDYNIVNEFEGFFQTQYRNAIRELSNSYPDNRSLYIDFFAIDRFNTNLAEGLQKEPDAFLNAATNALRDMDTENGVKLENAHVRISKLPTVTELKDIQHSMVNQLITIAGTVIQVNKPEPKIKIAVYECPDCHHEFSIYQPERGFKEAVACEGGCHQKAHRFKLLEDKCTTVTAQTITIRGLQNEQKEIELEDDLINQYAPGDNILITGIMRFFQNKKKDKKTAYLGWNMDVNSIEKVVHIYSEETIHKAAELLKNPKILDEFVEFLEKNGKINGKNKKTIIGEDKNKRLLFCSGLSAKCSKKIHCILIAQSSTGKSRLVSLLNLFFSTLINELFRTTARAIDYLGGNLDGKILILKEMAGGQSSQYSLRVVMDPESDELRILTVVKDEKTNEPRTITKETKGMPVFVSTTTSAHFDNQTKNRAFLLPLDETEEQTKKIHTADDKERKEILEDLTPRLDIFLCALDMLQPIEVKIPFSIEYPTKNVKARRSRSHLLDLVEVITSLHQYQREFIEIGENAENTQRYSIATKEDFDLAKDIAENSLSIDLGDISPNAEKLLKLFEEKGWTVSKEEKTAGKCTQSDFAHPEETKKIKVGLALKKIRENAPEYLGRSYCKSAIRGFLDELDEANRIVSDSGKPKLYYVLEEARECTKMNNVHVCDSYGENELSEWLDAMNNKHTFYSCEKGENLLSNIMSEKINHKRALNELKESHNAHCS